MSASCTLPLSFKPHLFHKSQSLLHDLNPHSSFQLSNPYHRSLSKTLVRCSNHEREESRWLREEQRWLREEQRWLREESRWHAERETLVQTISALKLRIGELEQRSVIQGEVDVPILNRIAKIGSGAVPLMLEVGEGEREKEADEVTRKRGTLRIGCEGDDVRAMQEALHKLGFYCGEEDVEFSSFSTGTERAVKTWQASIGAPEDGKMTAELQERLYTEHQVEYSTMIPKENRESTVRKANGAIVSPVTEPSVENKSKGESEVSQNRVFLLGENRWEEPSRLVGRNKAFGGAKSNITKCLCCRGEGRLLCAECDGSGEPNIEPQFLEWVDEGMKCPYCVGLGFTTCDVCDGKGVAVV